MYKLWPSAGLFVFAIWLFTQGHLWQMRAEKFQADHSPNVRIGDPRWAPDAGKAGSEIDVGRSMQIGAGILAVVGAVLFGLGLVHQKVQTQALKHRLAVTYTFVPVVPSEGLVPDAGLLTEDQAADLLRTRYPTLAKDAAEKVHKEFAEKRRLEPTKLWFVKDFLVSEAPVDSVQDIRTYNCHSSACGAADERADG